MESEQQRLLQSLARERARGESLRSQLEALQREAHLLRSRIAAAAPALEENDRRLMEAILASIHVALAHLDSSLNFIRVNPYFARIVGRKTEEFPGKNFFGLFPDPANREPLAQALLGGTYTAFSRPFPYARRPDGGETYWDWTAQPVRGPDGAVAGVALCLVDATDRALAQEALRHSEARLRNVMEAAGEAFILFDVVGAIRYWNPAAERMFGYSVGEAMGREVRLLLKGLDPAEALKGSPLIQRRIETSALHKDGHRLPVEMSLSTFGFHGDAYGIVVLRDIIGRKQAAGDQQRVAQALRALSLTSRTVLRAGDERSLMNDICREIVREGGYDLAWVAYSPHGDERNPEVILPEARGREFVQRRLPLRDCDPALIALRSGQQVVIRDIAGRHDLCDAWRVASLDAGYRSYAALPIRPDHRSLGVLSVYSSSDEAFGEEELTLLTELSSDLAYGIRALRLEAERDASAERHKEVMFQTVEAIARTVERRDPYTAGHHRHTSQLSAAIAREMGFSEERIEGVRLAALIHDLGKISIPAEFLNRPGRLTRSEQDVIRSHPLAGYEILRDIRFPWPVATTIRQHHERFDGSGYPDGLRNGEIIAEARILAVADALDAMAFHRPYRPALGLETALSELEAEDGKSYDPEVVRACVRLFREKRFSFE